MKKILLATTVLAMTATVAAAEMTVGGNARLGVIYGGKVAAKAAGATAAADANAVVAAQAAVNAATTTAGLATATAALKAAQTAAAASAAVVGVGAKAQFTSRIRVTFAGSGETDSGLSFGASIRADQAGVGNSGATAMSAGSVFISGAFGKLSMGDNDSAANALVGNVSGVGMTGLGDVNELGYLGQTDTSVLYTYSADALTVAVSASQTSAADDAVSVAAKYAFGDYAVALGYESTATDSQTSLGLSGKLGAAGVSLVAMDRESNADVHYALSVDYSMDAVGVTAFYASHGATDAFGFGASYDLGGNAKVVGGVSKSSGADAVADLGVSMSF